MPARDTQGVAGPPDTRRDATTFLVEARRAHPRVEGWALRDRGAAPSCGPARGGSATVGPVRTSLIALAALTLAGCSGVPESQSGTTVTQTVTAAPQATVSVTTDREAEPSTDPPEASPTSEAVSPTVPPRAELDESGQILTEAGFMALLDDVGGFDQGDEALIATGHGMCDAMDDEAALADVWAVAEAELGVELLDAHILLTAAQSRLCLEHSDYPDR